MKRPREHRCSKEAETPHQIWKRPTQPPLQTAAILLVYCSCVYDEKTKLDKKETTLMRPNHVFLLFFYLIFVSIMVPTEAQRNQTRSGFSDPSADPPVNQSRCVPPIRRGDKDAGRQAWTPPDHWLLWKLTFRGLNAPVWVFFCFFGQRFPSYRRFYYVQQKSFLKLRTANDRENASIEPVGHFRIIKTDLFQLKYYGTGL